MIGAVIFLIAMFLVYHYLVFELIDTFLKSPRLKSIYRIPVGIVNTLLAIAFTMLNGSTSFGTYLAISIILFVEFVIFYKDKRMSSLFCMLVCVIHIMAMRALCVAGFALTLGSTVYHIVNTPFLLVLSTGITMLILKYHSLYGHQAYSGKRD